MRDSHAEEMKDSANIPIHNPRSAARREAHRVTLHRMSLFGKVKQNQGTQGQSVIVCFWTMLHALFWIKINDPNDRMQISVDRSKHEPNSFTLSSSNRAIAGSSMLLALLTVSIQDENPTFPDLDRE